MGYFSNRTEADIYEEMYCKRCAHYCGLDSFCPVWDAHFMLDREQATNSHLAYVLNVLIPRDDQGHNGQCAMFYLRPIPETFATY